MTIPAQQIADMYPSRWQVELFFRWIKPHGNILTLFGQTENAVYGPLYSALIGDVVWKSLYGIGHARAPYHASLSFDPFSRFFLYHKLPHMWLVALPLFMRDTPIL